jgi:hypothetical protein
MVDSSIGAEGSSGSPCMRKEGSACLLSEGKQ